MNPNESVALDTCMVSVPHLTLPDASLSPREDALANGSTSPLFAKYAGAKKSSVISCTLQRHCQFFKRHTDRKIYQTKNPRYTRICSKSRLLIRRIGLDIGNKLPGCIRKVFIPRINKRQLPRNLWMGNRNGMNGKMMQTAGHRSGDQ